MFWSLDFIIKKDVRYAYLLEDYLIGYVYDHNTVGRIDAKI